MSTVSAPGARVRSVHSPGAAKNRNVPVSEVGTSALADASLGAWLGRHPWLFGLLQRVLRGPLAHLRPSPEWGPHCLRMDMSRRWPLRDAAVVSMLGTLTRRSSMDAFEATTVLSARLHAECFYLPGPIVCDSEASRDTIMRQPMLREVLNRALSADLAVVSVGGLDSGTIRRMRFVDEDEFRDVERAGAIGNFLGYYIDDQAAVIDHPVNRRVIGVRPEDIAAIPQRFMISGGPTKVMTVRFVSAPGSTFSSVTPETDAAASATA